MENNDIVEALNVRVKRINQVISLINDYGCEDGAHHKQWLLDQILAILLDDAFVLWLEEHPDWDRGTPI